MKLRQMLDKIKPKPLFLLDSLGALVSAIMLGFVLVKFQSIFGMPSNILYLLSLLAYLFSFYSFSCFYFTQANWRPYMKFIGIANLLYVCLTMALLIYLYEQMTVLGIFYFILEMIIIVVLAIVELKKASSSSH